ncbi:MAG: CopD family protein [Terriglobia bacterium]
MVAWTLVFHIIGLVFWVGSLLATTHVLAVHTEETSPEARAALGRLEMKLLKGLAHPGAAIMVISGIVLLTQDPFALRATWLYLKLILVAVLVALDLRVYFRAKAFNAGTIELGRGECMALHGVIAFILMAILILVLIKPFGLPMRGANSYAPEHPPAISAATILEECRG